MDLKTELKLVEEAEFAEFRGVSLAHLRNERSQGGGPEFIRIGRKVWYSWDVLRAYVKLHTEASATEAPTMVGKRKAKR